MDDAGAMRHGAGPATGSVFALDDKMPAIDPTAWIAPGAVVAGAVTLGAGASVWFNCTLRADTNTIDIGPRSNVQDGTVIHVNPGADFAVRIGADVTIGHAALVHACTLADGAFVGMAAVVLDGAVIETGGVLAAHSTLPPGKRIGAGELWMGTPARFARRVTEAERAGFDAVAPRYVERAAVFRRGLRTIR
jgi:carbonic anhydrase/acetyltransferase-like protein (isoleucine patch superfamily)